MINDTRENISEWQQGIAQSTYHTLRHQIENVMAAQAWTYLKKRYNSHSILYFTSLLLSIFWTTSVGQRTPLWYELTTALTAGSLNLRMNPSNLLLTGYFAFSNPYVSGSTDINAVKLSSGGSNKECRVWNRSHDADMEDWDNLNGQAKAFPETPASSRTRAKTGQMKNQTTTRSPILSYIQTADNLLPWHRLLISHHQGKSSVRWIQPFHHKFAAAK